MASCPSKGKKILQLVMINLLDWRIETNICEGEPPALVTKIIHFLT